MATTQKAAARPKAKAPAKKTTRKGRGYGGPERHTPTPELRAAVSAMSSISIPAEFIAAAIGIGRDTLFKYYKENLAPGGAGPGGAAMAIKTLFTEMAKGGRTGASCAMFYLKTRMNQFFSERFINENKDIENDKELSRYTEDDAIRIAENILKQAKGAKTSNSSPSIDDEPAGTA